MSSSSVAAISSRRSVIAWHARVPMERTHVNEPEKPAKIPGKESTAPPLKKRFYTHATVEPEVQTAGLFAIKLDGRGVKTPKKATLAVPGRAFADAIADEWNTQGEHIDPRTMPLTRLANTVIDGVQGHEEDVRADILKFAGSDLLCYRAERPETLVTRQTEAWDPVLGWAAKTLGARMVLGEGVMPVPQSQECINAVAAALAPADAYRLAALHVITTLTGSVLLALAHLDGYLSAEETWERAHVDDDWQAEQWGEDAEAVARRRRRWSEMQAASRMMQLINRL